MTKRKPDRVNEIRISLQDKQSEQLDDIVTSYMIGNVLPSVVSLMKDVTGMIVLLSILAGLIGFKFRPVGLDVPDVIDEFLTQRQQAIAAGVIISGGPLGPGIGLRLAQLLGLLPEQDQNGGGGGGGF